MSKVEAELLRMLRGAQEKLGKLASLGRPVSASASVTSDMYNLRFVITTDYLRGRDIEISLDDLEPAWDAVHGYIAEVHEKQAAVAANMASELGMPQ